MKKIIFYALILCMFLMPQAFAKEQTNSETAWQSFFEQHNQEGNSHDWPQVSQKLEHIVDLSKNETDNASWRALNYLDWLATSYEWQDRDAEALRIRLQMSSMFKDLNQQMPKDATLTPKYKAYASRLSYRLGVNYYRIGNHAAAEPLILDELSRRQKENPIDEAALFLVRNMLAGLYIEWGKYDEAEKYAQLNFKSAQLPTSKNINLINSLSGLAVLRREQGRFSEAETLFVQELALSKAEHESEREYQRITVPFAAMLIDLNRLDEASELLKTALTSRIKNDTLFRVGNVQLYVADIALRQGNLIEAQENYNKALGAYKATVGLNKYTVAQAYYGLAEIARLKGDVDQAKQFYSDALRIQQRFLVKNHPDTIKTLLALSSL